MVDSLEKVLETLPSPTNTLADTLRVQVLNKLAFTLRNIEVRKAVQMAHQASTLAEKINYQKGLATSLGYEGLLAYRQGKYDLAINFHHNSLKIALAINDSVLVAFRYNDLTNIYLDKGEYDKALTYNLKALSIQELRKNKEGIATGYRNSGIAYLHKKDYNKALTYLQRGSQLALEINDQRLLAYHYVYLGQVYVNQKKVKQALKLLKRAITINQKIENYYGLAEALNSLAQAQKEANQLEQAIETFEEALSISQKIGIKLETQRAYQGLSLVYEKQGLIPISFEYYKKFILVRDSIFSEQSAEVIAYLETQFENQRKQSQIKELTQQQLLSKKEVEKANLVRNISVIFGVLVFVLFIFLAFLFFKNKAANQILSQQSNNLKLQNIEINQQKEKLESQAEQLNIANNTKNKLFSIIGHDLRGPTASLSTLLELIVNNDVSQEEFKQLAPELQHNVKNMYATLENLLQWSKTQLNNIQTNPQKLNIQELIEEQFGLFQATANTKSIKLTANYSNIYQPYADLNHIRLVLRNLINNAIKFTQIGGTITVTCQNKYQDNNQVAEIVITDTGVGMSEDTVIKIFSKGQSFTSYGTSGEKGTGLGLLLCKEMIEKNNGQIGVISKLGEGSSFYFTLPVEIE